MGDSSFDWSPAAIAVPILSFITLVLCLPPFVWHVKNRNIAASSLVFWILLNNIFNFINALIWPTDDITSWWNGAVLCDIEVKLMTAAAVGLNGSMACVVRNLAQVMDTKRTVLEPSRARRRNGPQCTVLFRMSYLLDGHTLHRSAESLLPLCDFWMYYVLRQQLA